MIAVVLATALTLAEGSLVPDPELLPGALLDEAGEPGDPCAAREDWVGDGAGGRDPPGCDGDDGGAEPDGPAAPDLLRREEDGDGEDRPGYER